MKYKEVIKEQIEKLQSIQNDISERPDKRNFANEACRVADVINTLVAQAVDLESKLPD